MISFHHFIDLPATGESLNDKELLNPENGQTQPTGIVCCPLLVVCVHKNCQKLNISTPYFLQMFTVFLDFTSSAFVLKLWLKHFFYILDVAIIIIAAFGCLTGDD